MDRRRTAAPDQKRSRAITRWTYRPALSSSPEARGRQGLKSGIRNVTIDFSPEQGDGEDANRHAVVEKRKTCGAKEFGPSQRSAGSLAGVHRHDPVTVNWKQRGAPTRDSPSQRRHRQKKKPSRSAATRRRRRKTPAAASRKEPRPRAERQVPRSRTGTKTTRAPKPTPRGAGTISAAAGQPPWISAPPWMSPAAAPAAPAQPLDPCSCWSLAAVRQLALGRPRTCSDLGDTRRLSCAAN